MLEGAPQPEPGHAAGRLAGDHLAVEADTAAVGGDQAAQLVEHGALAGAVRPDQRHDLTGGDGEADTIVGHQAAEALGDALAAENFAAGVVGGRQARRVRHRRWARQRKQPGYERDEAAGHALHHQDDDGGEGHALEIAGPAEQTGQPVVQLVAQQGHDAGAQHRAPERPRAPPMITMNRYSIPAVRSNGVGLT